MEYPLGLIVLLSILCVLFIGTQVEVHATIFSNGDSEVMHDERYQRGKAQFDALQTEARMPKYSKCWTDALQSLSHGCKKLNDEVQHRLALGFTNCFLLKTGRETYPCEADLDISDCVKHMKSEAYNTYTEFFTHTQNICFFLQAQVWQAETQKTIASLSENSAQVAQQIEDSGILQHEILQKQNESLSNQDILLTRGKELKGALEDSAVDVKFMLKEFKEATAEQRANIMDVFDRIQSLQSLVMGEFTGFYSMVFYTTSLIVSYLLTSTPRTSGARFWLFFIMTLNVVCERLLVIYGAEDRELDTGQIVNGSEIVYWRLTICRKLFSVIGMLTLLVIALLFEDINKVNNHLLQTITEQNQQIKHLLQSSAVNHGSYMNDSSQIPTPKGNPIYDPVSDHVDSAIGYESDTESESSFDSGTTDHTFKADNEASDTDAESFVTSGSGRQSRSGTPALLEELHYLREGTPVKGGGTPVKTIGTPVKGMTNSQSGYSTGIFDSSPIGPSGDAITSTPQKRRGRPPLRQTPLNISDVPSTQTRYNLRCRHGTPALNPVVNTETEGDFHRQVQHLARISARNSRKTKYTLDRLRQNRRDYSTDEG